jgi:hypothetical protein
MLPPKIRPSSEKEACMVNLLEFLSKFQGGLSQTMTEELSPLRTLLERTANEMDIRLQRVEDQLRSAIKHNWQLSQTSDIMLSTISDQQISDKQALVMSLGSASSTSYSENQISLSLPLPDPDCCSEKNAAAAPTKIELSAICDESGKNLQPNASELCSDLNCDLLSIDPDSSLAKSHFAAPKCLQKTNTIKLSLSALQGEDQRVIYGLQDVARKVPACCCGLWGLSPCLDEAIKAVLKALFGISDPNIWSGHPGSSVIHPSSPFCVGTLSSSCYPSQFSTLPRCFLYLYPLPLLLLDHMREVCMLSTALVISSRCSHGVHVCTPASLLRRNRPRAALLLEHVSA